MKLLSTTIPVLCTVASTTSANPGFSWGENTGRLNWSPANGSNQGPAFKSDSINGYAWGENIGWLNLGQTDTPPPTDMQTGASFGVGIDPDGFLFGYAWGENIGWVSFDLPQLGAQRPRFHRGRLFGYAWAENAGWINLDDDTHFVQLACPTDVNGDEQINFFDITTFIGQFNSGSLRADWNLDGTLNVFDIFAFIAEYGQPCTL